MSDEPISPAWLSLRARQLENILEQLESMARDLPDVCRPRLTEAIGRLAHIAGYLGAAPGTRSDESGLRSGTTTRPKAATNPKS